MPEPRLNPFLHISAERVYNPLSDRELRPVDEAFAELQSFLRGGPATAALENDGWLVSEDVSRHYLLKIVSLETMTTCNQKCYFCPVSIAPREDEAMSKEMFARIVGELTAFRGTLEGVFLQSYNEPTIDRDFVDHCRTLFSAGLPVAVLTNGSGLTRARVDELMAAGQLRFLCVNLSTLDRERYARDRGADHLDLVLRNLDYIKDKPLALEMKVVVLGQMDEVHRADFEAIRERFAGTRFNVDMQHATDRAGWLDIGQHRVEPIRKLAGCELIGSRPIQHLHITPAAKAILCCQDYDENYIVGDLNRNTIREVLEGDDMARVRKWVYGVEEAPEDFICRTCVFALGR